MTAKPQKNYAKWAPRRNVFYISLGIKIVKYTAYDFLTEKSNWLEQIAR